MCADECVPPVVLCHIQALTLGLPHLVASGKEVCFLSQTEIHNGHFLNNHKESFTVCCSQNIFVAVCNKVKF
jgi:hypothetical protein